MLEGQAEIPRRIQQITSCRDNALIPSGGQSYQGSLVNVQELGSGHWVVSADLLVMIHVNIIFESLRLQRVVLRHLIRPHSSMPN